MERAQSQAEPLTRAAIELATECCARPGGAAAARRQQVAVTPTEQEVCCTADAKAECCGTATLEGCGCR